MKKMNNKGFSLVELIIVIAIMAVLVGVLAPQFLKYVEKSRISRDEQTMGEVNNAVKVALSNEDVYNATSTGTTLTWGAADVSTWGSDALGTELDITVPNAKKFGSKKYSGTDAQTEITITTSGAVTVETTHTGGFSVK